MKKLFKSLVCITLVFGLVACGNSDSDNSTANKITDGVYKGVGQGKGGDIVLNVTIESDIIKSIEVVSQNETSGFDAAIKTMSDAVLATNSLEVDTVSGCSLTSNGFLEAMNNAFNEANVTPDMLAKVEAGGSVSEKDPLTEDYDVVVIGAGGAGLNAAIQATLDGADVLVIEKMSMAGGNTFISGAEMAAPNNWIQKRDGLEDSVELMIQDTLTGGDNINNPDLVTVVATNALEGAEWLRDEVGVIWEDELMFFGGHSVKRSLIPLGASGVEIIEKQLAKSDELNIPIYYNTKANELVVTDGVVTGVKADQDGRECTFTADSVILATGGFGSNVDMRVKYNPAIDGSILSTNSVGSQGDGITMAEKIGANLIDMEHIQTYPICDPLTGTLLYFDDARLYGHSVIINKEGKRFVEELGRRDVMSFAIKEQTGNVCYEIIDENGFVTSKLQENHGPELDYLYNNQLLVKADTLEEAAAFFGIDLTNLKKTLDDYNTYVDNGSDPEFNKRSLPSKIEVGPYYILKAAPAVHHTMGGIQINTEAQVIDVDGNVIEGLYAAGEVTGGIHGTNRLGSNAIADITVFGRIAGSNAAKAAK